MKTDTELKLECLKAATGVFQALKPSNARTDDVIKLAEKVHAWVTGEAAGKSARDM